MRCARYLAIGVLSVLFLAAIPLGAADKKEAEQTKQPTREDEEKNRLAEEYMANMALVARLKELGYDKENPSPESLVTAAFILRKMQATRGQKDLEVKPEAQREPGASDESPLVDTVGKMDYDKEISDLLDDARARAAKKKVDLEPLINEMKSRKVDQGRLVLGGLQQVVRSIGGRQTHTYHINARPNELFYFAFRSLTPLQVTIVRSRTDTVFAAGIVTGANTSYFPRTQSPVDRVPFTIKITNLTPYPTKYQMCIR